MDYVPDFSQIIGGRPLPAPYMYTLPGEAYYDFAAGGFRQTCHVPKLGLGTIVSYEWNPTPSNACLVANFVPVPGSGYVDYGEAIPPRIPTEELDPNNPQRFRIGKIFISKWQNTVRTRVAVETVYARIQSGTSDIDIPFVAGAPVHYVLPPAPVFYRKPKTDPTLQEGLSPALKPYEVPALVTVGGSGRTRGGAHARLPPGRGVKENKNLRGIPAALGALLNVGTEGLEVLDALHSNLPRNLQAKGYTDRFGNSDPSGRSPTPQQKAAAVYRNLNQVDMYGFAADMIANQVEDAFYGKLGKAGGKLARYGNWLAGPQAGIGL